MCRIKSEIYSTDAGWIWATWAESRIGPIWFPFVTYMVWNRVAKPLSVPYGLPILDPYKILYGTLIGPILFADRVGGLSLPRKSVVRLNDRPDMTLDVYRGRKTTAQQQQHRSGC